MANVLLICKSRIIPSEQFLFKECISASFVVMYLLAHLLNHMVYIFYNPTNATVLDKDLKL